MDLCQTYENIPSFISISFSNSVFLHMASSITERLALQAGQPEFLAWGRHTEVKHTLGDSSVFLF